MVKLVVGLGNPGPEYADTRHNVGFRALDRIAAVERLFFEPAKSLEGYTKNPAFRFARAPELDALLVQPSTYMNRSGRVVRPLLEWAGGEPADLWVVYDDLDLDLGRLRIRPRGGAGTHNGMRSILTELGTGDFPRVRIGIGPARGDVADFVLQPFDEREREDAEISVIEAADATLDWLRSGDLEACMTRFHTRWNQGP